MKIMLVDDSRTMRNIQKKILTAMGNPEFVEAGDGQEALQIFTQTPTGYYFILIDWNMPNMDGLTLVGKIREKDKKTPLIMVTTEAEKQRVIDAIKAGVNNYVIKPFTADTLMQKVQQTLQKAGAPAAIAA